MYIYKTLPKSARKNLRLKPFQKTKVSRVLTVYITRKTHYNFCLRNKGFKNTTFSYLRFWCVATNILYVQCLLLCLMKTQRHICSTRWGRQRQLTEREACLSYSRALGVREGHSTRKLSTCAQAPPMGDKCL